MSRDGVLLDAWVDDAGTVWVAGAVGSDVTPGFRDMLVDHMARGPLTLDLSLVTYLPLTAVGAIVAALRVRGPYLVTIRARQGCLAQRTLHRIGLPHSTGSDGDLHFSSPA